MVRIDALPRLLLCVFREKAYKESDGLKEEDLMDRKTQWLSLVAGFLLFLYGLKKLYQEGDWGLFVISALIMAFTVSMMLRARQK